MALDLGGGGAGFARPVRRAPVFGGHQNPQMLAALQQLFEQHVGGGPQLRHAMPAQQYAPGGGDIGIEPPGLGGQPGMPGLMPGGGHLIPLPNPQLGGLRPANPIGPGDLRRGLLELLHPNLRGIIGGKKAIPGKPISRSIPQNNLRIAIPAVGPFHHNAAVTGPSKVQRLLDLRRQHVQDAQAQAGQMANMLRKSRAMGPAPRRAIPAGY